MERLFYSRLYIYNCPYLQCQFYNLKSYSIHKSPGLYLVWVPFQKSIYHLASFLHFLALPFSSLPFFLSFFFFSSTLPLPSMSPGPFLFTLFIISFIHAYPSLSMWRLLLPFHPENTYLYVEAEFLQVWSELTKIFELNNLEKCQFLPKNFYF